MFITRKDEPETNASKAKVVDKNREKDTVFTYNLL